MIMKVYHESVLIQTSFDLSMKIIEMNISLFKQRTECLMKASNALMSAIVYNDTNIKLK